MRDSEHSRTVPPDYFAEGGLVSHACLTRQLEVRRLFVSVRQKRSSFEVTKGGPAITESADSVGEDVIRLRAVRVS